MQILGTMSQLIEEICKTGNGYRVEIYPIAIRDDLVWKVVLLVPKMHIGWKEKEYGIGPTIKAACYKLHSKVMFK